MHQKRIFSIWLCLEKQQHNGEMKKGIKGKHLISEILPRQKNLVVLINLEDTNADLIRQEVPKIERLKAITRKSISTA